MAINDSLCILTDERSAWGYSSLFNASLWLSSLADNTTVCDFIIFRFCDKKTHFHSVSYWPIYYFFYLILILDNNIGPNLKPLPIASKC